MVEWHDDSSNRDRNLGLTSLRFSLVLPGNALGCTFLRLAVLTVLNYSQLNS